MKITELPTSLSPVEKVILKESFVSISHNETENWLYIFWEGERTSETLMQGAEILLKCVQETGCTKIINDSSAFSNAWPNLIDWFAIQYAPRLQAAGVQYFAWIYDDQNLTKLAADAILEKEKSDIIVMVFDKVNTAKTWLRAIR